MRMKQLDRLFQETERQDKLQKATEHLEAIRRHTAGPVRDVIDWHLDEVTKLLNENL